MPERHVTVMCFLCWKKLQRTYYVDVQYPLAYRRSSGHVIFGFSLGQQRLKLVPMNSTFSSFTVRLTKAESGNQGQRGAEQSLTPPKKNLNSQKLQKHL